MKFENAEIQIYSTFWDEATVIARESDKTTRWIWEAVKIRQESQGAMNRDEGAYQLSHIYDKLLLPLRTSIVGRVISEKAAAAVEASISIVSKILRL